MAAGMAGVGWGRACRVQTEGFRTASGLWNGHRPYKQCILSCRENSQQGGRVHGGVVALG